MTFFGLVHLMCVCSVFHLFCRRCLFFGYLSCSWLCEFYVCSILSYGVSIKPYNENRKVIGSLIKLNSFDYLCLKENQLNISYSHLNLSSKLQISEFSLWYWNLNNKYSKAIYNYVTIRKTFTFCFIYEGSSILQTALRLQCLEQEQARHLAIIRTSGLEAGPLAL